MSLPPTPLPPPDARRSLLRGGFAALSAQWQRLSAHSQAVWGYLFPLLTVVLFTIVMLGAYLFLRMEEKAREAQALEQRSQFLALRLSELLLSKQEDIQHLVNGLEGHTDKHDFDSGARTLIARDASLYALRLMDTQHREITSLHSAMLRGRLPGAAQQGQQESARRQSHWELTLTEPGPGDASAAKPAGQSAALRLHTPMYAREIYLGSVVAEYSPQLLLGALLSQGGVQDMAVALVDARGQRIAGMEAVSRHDALGSQLAHVTLPVAPLGEHMRLQATLYRSDENLIGNALFVLMMLLGLTTIVTLLLNWRLSRYRLQAQRKLHEESNFRLAIENALTTGIRVLDMEGTTTYTNAAFSRMVGWNQEEMVGMRAPFPYWPPKDKDVLMERFRAELAGRHYPNGLQLRMRRRNGSTFDARIHLVPLRDEHGAQTGWLSTITDITEPNRIRQQLSAAHDRFTRVLEALDASISVAPLGSHELLFANRMYRQWFGSDSQGHMHMLAGASIMQTGDAIEEEDALMGLPSESITSANSERAEMYVQALDKWLEVRSRYLDWVDGRLAQMLIATDITKRKQAEEQAARQVAKMETVSRLMTMGEMASSVAHELNQPLAAITNYTNGMISRIKAGTIDREGLLTPLEKTAHQAIRAGQVIQRIRSFVKRSESVSEICSPHRLVSEAVELANIEIRKRNTRLSVYMEPNLPMLEVDAILIEQVLINLLKNAAEAVDGAQKPPHQRGIDLRLLHHESENGQGRGVRFVITDQGPGLPEETLGQLFDAFYSTKRDGMGIGLNLCRSIIETHHGQLQVRNLYNGDPAQGQVSGCEFSFWLPASPHGSADDPESHTPPLPILG